MTADRRFPYMDPIDGRHLRGLDTHDSKRVSDWARSITNSTMTKAWWNRLRGEVAFCLRGPEAAVTAPRVKDRAGVVALPDSEWVKRCIYKARKPREVKDREIARAQAEGDYQRRKAQEKKIEEDRGPALDRAASILRGRVSVTKDWA